MNYNVEFKKAIDLYKSKKFNKALAIIENMVNEYYDDKKLYYLILCISSQMHDDRRFFYYIYYLTRNDIWFDPILLQKSNQLQYYMEKPLFKYYIEYCSLCKQSRELI